MHISKQLRNFENASLFCQSRGMGYKYLNKWVEGRKKLKCRTEAACLLLLKMGLV